MVVTLLVVDGGILVILPLSVPFVGGGSTQHRMEGDGQATSSRTS